MKGSEIFIVLVMGYAGYIIVSVLLHRFEKKKAPDDTSRKDAPREEKSSREKETGANPDFESTPHWSTVLGILRGASDAEIRAAFKKQVSLYHPDKVASLGAEFNEVAQRRTKEINAAYVEAMSDRR